MRWILLIGIAAAFLPAFAGRGELFLAIEILTLLAIAQSWNLLAGYAGLISFGHHVFIGFGAYFLYVVTREVPVISPYLVIPIAGLAAMLLAVLLFPILFRLREVYLAIGMAVAAEIAKILTVKSEWLGGSTGLPFLAARSMNREWFAPITFWMALALVLVIAVIVHWLNNSVWGLHLKSLRDDEVAAGSLGVNTTRIKGMVFAFSAAGCGIAGAIWFMASLFVGPAAAYDLNWMVYVIFICVIGGLGTNIGPFIGVGVYFALRETLAFSSGWYLVALGGVAIAIVLVAPKGLASLRMAWKK